MMPLGLAVWFAYPIVFLFGASVGSFLNVCIWRMPRRESIVHPPSHCPTCNARLTTLDLFPLLSFLFLRARCRHCGAPISWRYFWIELLAACWFLLAFWYFGVQMGMWVRWGQVTLFGAALIAIFFIDLEHYEIPHELTVFAILVGFVADGIALHVDIGNALDVLVVGGYPIPGAVAGLMGGHILFALIFLISNVIYSRTAGEGEAPAEPTAGPAAEPPGPSSGGPSPSRLAVIGEYLLFIPFAWVMVIYDLARSAIRRGKAAEEDLEDDTPAFGFGDVMLAAAIGANLGLANAGVAFFLALVIGAVVSIALMSLRLKGLKSHVPFGPFLVVGAILAIFFAPQIIGWYLGFWGLGP